MLNTNSSSDVLLTLKRNMVPAGLIATKLWLHPLDENMGATTDGSIWTRYVGRKRGGVVGEWRQITSFRSDKVSGKGNQGPTPSSEKLSNVTLPLHFCRIAGKGTNSYKAGRFTLECYLKRRLESWEVCRHGIGGPNDHSFANVSPGDSVNNMIDDLENGQSKTNLTYLIQAKNRIDRLIANRLNTTK